MTNTLQVISAPQLSYILISWEPHWMNTEPGIPRVLNWCLKWMNILLAANAMSQAKLQRMSPTQASIHLTCEDCGLHQKISEAKGNNRHLRVTANELRTWANSLVFVSSRKHTNLFFCPGSAAGAAALKSGQGPPGRVLAVRQFSPLRRREGPPPQPQTTRSGQKLPRFTVFCALPIFSHVSDLVAQDGSTWANMGLKIGQHSPQDGPT